MEASAHSLVASPDGALLRSAERSLSGLGLIALLAHSLAEAQRMLARVRVELLCLDSVLPIEEAERFWRWLSSDRSRPAPALIVLAPQSARLASSALPGFFRPDHDGLVAKPLGAGELEREATRLLSARPRKREASLLRAGTIALDTERRELLFADGGVISPTPTEFRLLRCLLERAGEFISAEELVAQVWQYPPGTGGPELVRAHMSNLRRKLRSAGQDPQLLRTVPYQGYGIAPGNGERRG